MSLLSFLPKIVAVLIILFRRSNINNYMQYHLDSEEKEFLCPPLRALLKYSYNKQNFPGNIRKSPRFVLMSYQGEQILASANFHG